MAEEAQVASTPTEQAPAAEAEATPAEATPAAEPTVEAESTQIPAVEVMPVEATPDKPSMPPPPDGRRFADKPAQQQPEPEQAAQPPSEEAPTEAPPTQAKMTAESYVVPDYVSPQMRKTAADNNFTQGQFNVALKEMGGVLQNQAKIQQANLEKQGQKQMADWGNDAAQNISVVRRALKQSDPSGEMTKILNESGYGNHPVVLRHLLALGKSMQEGGYLKSATHTPSGHKTRAQKLFPNMNSSE